MLNSHDISLSSLWRKNASADPAIDLVSVLDGARIMAQSLAPNVEVEYEGVKNAKTDKKTITLSPAKLGDKHPIPGANVDVFLGTGVHKIGEILFTPDRQQYINGMYKIANSPTRQSYDKLIYLGKIIALFEDIYVDSIMSGFPVYRDYLRRSNEDAVGDYDAGVITDALAIPCSRVDMLNALCYFTLLNGKPNAQEIDPDNLKILSGILNEAADMVSGKKSKDKCILRAYQLLCTLPEIVDQTKNPKFQPPAPPDNNVTPPDSNTKQPTPQDNNQDEQSGDNQDVKSDSGEKTADNSEDDESDNEQDGNEDDEETEDDGTETSDSDKDDKPEKLETTGANAGADTGDSKQANKPDTGSVYIPQDLVANINSLVDDNTPMDSSLAKQVADAIIEKHDDLTQLVSHLAGNSDCTIVAYTPENDDTMALEARAGTMQAEERLRRVFQEYKLWKTKDYHGLREGRVSSNRLYRTSYGDDRVFKRREQPDAINMAICLLVDLSGSVVSSRSLINQVVCSMCDAMQKEKVSFFAIGYSMDTINSKSVYIPRLYDPETQKVRLNLTKEWGWTPSYEGIASGIAQLLRFGGQKHKVLIHFTDGSPNSGNTEKIPELLQYARQHGIADIHICVPGSDVSVAKFRNIYGVSNTHIINSINDLPEQIEKELREKMKEE